jgi:methyl-accepting chemotaxis protein
LFCETNQSYAPLNSILDNIITVTLEIIKTKVDKNTVYESDLSAEKTIETIKEVAEKIRKYSVMMRETTKTVRQSGAIPEIAEAIREAVFAVRDTTKDIHQTAKELKESGVIDETARAIKETRRTAQETIHTVRNTTDQVLSS